MYYINLKQKLRNNLETYMKIDKFKINLFSEQMRKSIQIEFYLQ